MSALAKRATLLLVTALALLGAACGGGSASESTPTKPPLNIGVMYDGTGATQSIGLPFKNGIEDYVRLVNSKGGVEGHPVNVQLIEMAYEVARGVEAYERMKQDGAVMVLAWGSGTLAAIAERCNADRVPCIIPGGGVARMADGQKYPFIFPMTANFWSQAAAAVKYALDQWKAEGRPGKPKIAFIYNDTAGGREPIELLQRIAQLEGFELRLFAVPLPGLDLSAQVQDIVQRYRADWVVSHLFGRSPSVAIKQFKEVGFPLNHVINLGPGASDDAVRAAGGWDVAEGFLGAVYTDMGTDLPILAEITKMYQEEGRQPPPDITQSNTYYVQGVADAALMVEGLRQAVKKYGYPLDGVKARDGLRLIRGNVAGVVSVQMSERDHEGGGQVRIYQVKGGRWQPVTEWFSAYRDVIQQMLQS